ncbi:MAG: uracil-DNA glycosylase, partial [Armatimonadetes bacterium]|nr:uracil-DNA glycosylase [Candidatus Hippobium faecium]
MENYRKITEKLHNLKKEIRECRACSLSLSRRNTVFGEGNPLSPFMIIGEAPGANEDEMSAPFVGKAGKFLDGCLAECGLDRSL